MEPPIISEKKPQRWTPGKTTYTQMLRPEGPCGGEIQSDVSLETETEVNPLTAEGLH